MNRIVTVLPEHHVVAAAAAESVGIETALHVVGAGPSGEHIRSVGALDRVVARATGHEVVALRPLEQGVAAEVSEDAVGAEEPAEDVRRLLADLRPDDDVRVLVTISAVALAGF